MKKQRLDVTSLEVQSFITSETVAQLGTVRGYDSEGPSGPEPHSCEFQCETGATHCDIVTCDLQCGDPGTSQPPYCAQTAQIDGCYSQAQGCTDYACGVTSAATCTTCG